MDTNIEKLGEELGEDVAKLADAANATEPDALKTAQKFRSAARLNDLNTGIKGKLEQLTFLAGNVDQITRDAAKNVLATQETGARMNMGQARARVHELRGDDPLQIFDITINDLAGLDIRATNFPLETFDLLLAMLKLASKKGLNQKQILQRTSELRIALLYFIEQSSMEIRPSLSPAKKKERVRDDVFSHLLELALAAGVPDSELQVKRKQFEKMKK